MTELSPTSPLDLPAEARHALAGLLRGTLRSAPLLSGTGWVTAEGALDPRACCLFGADVGGTKVQSVLTDLDGQVLAETRDATPEAGGDAVLDVIHGHLQGLSAGRGVGAAGIGLPGALDPVSGVLDRAPNLRGLDGQPMPALFSARLGLPVAVENDVNLAALGESWLGHGAGSSRARDAGLAFIALGTGIGMGLAFGDRLLRGASGAAGEIACLPIGGDPFSAEARRLGTLESVVAGQVLVEDYKARGGARDGSLRELSRAGVADPVLDETLGVLAERLALAVLSVGAVLDPALVVFGGGIGSRPEILARVGAALERLGAPAPELRISLLGNRAGAIGAVRAARLALADALERA
ncbi:ROK family protein [Oceanicola sp. S124]|uniref:ROK family protein n=1 Tax=Oceanicola sp. S124 TaxID=1042378 RepID=UPI00143C9BE0|nr:ROK family protein [Oceanicola sp. S124]